MHGYGGFGGFGFMGIFSMVIWLVILIVIIYFLFMFIRDFGSKNGITKTRKNHAHNILKERYARGEITKEEYLSMKKDLED
ncbi:conserved hypothetical protein [Deferribacter desulfuricans SSM1]|uniref:SHOCT domain-containing protein n=2 Tax=Deferribacter TaxID=53572 RepID=D3PCR3_DEFDS|nr:conserved hypothetical protein [Deferribacter desulfuricans SSM1]